MKTLSLIRHAEACAPNFGERDFDRSLTERGQQDAAEMAATILQGRQQNHEIFAPEVLVSSPANRAQSTADIFCRTLALPASQLTMKIYEAPLNHLIRVVENLADNHRHIGLVGHNPGLSMLAQWLCNDYRDMPPCCVIQIELQIDHWNETSQGIGKIMNYLAPSLLH